MSDKKIKIAVIGVGYWGPQLVRNFHQLDNVIIDTVCDINQEKLNKIKKNYPNIKTTKDFKDILENPEITAVVIALPTELHYQFAKLALEKGKHILITKPMTQNSSQAEELVKLAEEKGKLLMVDHTFLYYGPILKIKEVINSGELGEIYYFDSQRVNLGLIRDDVNVIWDLASHDISILNFLVQQKPMAVSAIGISHIGGKNEDLAHITIRYESGLMAHIHVSWLSPVKIRQILIGGSKKMILFDDIQPDEKIKIYDKSIEVDFSKETPFEPIYRVGEVRIPVIDQTEALLKECQYFIECIESGKNPLTSGGLGLEIVKILEACDKSLKEKGREVNLN